MSDANGLTKEKLLFAFPFSLRESQSIAALGDVTAEVLSKRPAEIGLLSIYPRIDELPEDLLDILARDFKVDWWDPDYTLEEKRRIFKDSWYVHKHMGTKAAVERAISAIYPETKVQEWFEYGGKPYHFKLNINITGTKWSEEKPRRVLERANFYKSLRSHLDELEYVQEAKQPAVLRTGGRVAAGIKLPVTEQKDALHFEKTAYLGGKMGGIFRQNAPEIKDEFRFQHAQYLGGKMGGVFRQNVPQNRDEICLENALGLGGKMTVVNSVPIPWGDIEIAWSHVLERKENTGGKMALVSRQSVPAAPDRIVYPYELSAMGRIGGLIGRVTQLPITIADDRTVMEMTGSELRVGGLLGTETRIVIPAGSSTEAPHNSRGGGQAVKSAAVPLPEIKT